MSPSPATDYRAFLEAKVAVAPTFGFDVDPAEVSPALKPHQAAIVRWMVAGGRRACFASFGLGKTVIQLEAVRLTRARAGGRGLIVLPLGVRGEFVRDARDLLAWSTPPRFIRSTDEATDPEGIYLTNYESVREGKIDTTAFTVVSLDEAAVLRGFGGTKTFREFMRLLAGDAGRGPSETGNAKGARWTGGGVRYRYLATATPSPNEYIELLAYSAFLGVMDVSAAKTRFFKRDSTKADNLTLHGHKADEFWRWVASWGLFVERPSDLDPSFSDEGYVLPPLEVRWHELPTDHSRAGSDKDGQGRLIRDAAVGVTEASREKRDSMDARVETVARLAAETPGEPLVVWCDLNDEQAAIERALGGDVASLYGAQDLEEREALMDAWRSGTLRTFLSKPTMYGAGVNLQRSARVIFAGIGFKFGEFIQACHRCHRFGQTRPVVVDLVYTEAERTVRQSLEEKWARHNETVAAVAGLIREHGLAAASLAYGLTRKMDVTRREASGKTWRLVNNDSCEEMRALPENSVGLVVTSIPFSTQYEYTPSYRDFGHTDDDAHFFRQMDFLTPELLRVLQPGRVAAVHVKDRIVPGGLAGYGFQTVSPFSDHTVAHFRRHGFAFLARITIVTDVVRENNQTYRLGWTEQCKDGSRMGRGMPEYVLLFRKPPTSSENGYADLPVVKAKDEYSRSRWQIDAHGFWRSSGNRALSSAEVAGLPHDVIFKLFRDHGLSHAYDYEGHVALGEAIDARKRLPVTFMLLQPPSWHPNVWTDVARMRTLNTTQASRGAEMHLCPLPLDLVERLVSSFSMPGETVLDPFAGIGTVPSVAVKLRRFGLGCELSDRYWADGAYYCAAAEREVNTPTLFDMLGAETAAEGAA